MRSASIVARFDSLAWQLGIPRMAQVTTAQRVIMSALPQSVLPHAPVAIRRFDAALGAEVLGLDLHAPLPDEEFARIHRATSTTMCSCSASSTSRRTDKVFAGLAVVVIAGLVVENLVFGTIERLTVRRWSMQR